MKQKEVDLGFPEEVFLVLEIFLWFMETPQEGSKVLGKFLKFWAKKVLDLQLKFFYGTCLYFD